MAEYVLDHHLEGERSRLALMSRLLDPMHRRHIESLGVGPGARALEVGCGNGSISAWLAERVGPRGQAVAFDLDLSLVDVRAPNLELQTGRHRRRPGRSRRLRSRDRAGGAAPRHGRRGGDSEPRRQLGARGLDPADRAGLPAGQRRRAARGASVLERVARMVARRGDRLPRGSHTGPAARGGRASSRSRARPRPPSTTGALPWAAYWTQTVIELRDRLVDSGRLDDRLIDRFLAHCADPSWWTQTIAFTAVHARAPGG